MKLILTNSFCLLFLLCHGQYSIGHTTITFNDPARTGGYGSGGGSGRQIQTEIYYPAATAGENVPVLTGEYPIIVFGHGFAMTWDAYSNIWQRYAAKGYILAFPRTEGSLIPAPSHNDFGLDLRQVEQKLTALNTNASSPFYQRINGNSAIMGHSMGGGAAILASNGNTSIKTVIGLAPAETNPSAINAAPGVTVPTLVFSGSSDGVTPPQDHHIPIYDGIGSACKSFVSITGGAHCYFANTNFNCDFGESTSSFGISISRSQQQTITYSLLDHWLEYTLKDDCAALTLFLDQLSGGSGFTGSTTCTQNPTPSINASGTLLTSSVNGSGYQWYLNGNPVSGANAIQYNALQGGTYTVVVSFPQGCSLESAPYELQSAGLSVGQGNVLIISPNPTSGKVKLESSNLDIHTVTVTSISGEAVFCSISDNEIDLSAQPRGIYFIGVNGHFVRVIKY
jgi:pimeloyl-ACP methyl ester carboxylesterase